MLSNSERLYYITQLAKDIFIQKAKKIDFTIPSNHLSTVMESFKAAELFVNGQEQYVECGIAQGEIDAL
jgi:hypothetical protein